MSSKRTEQGGAAAARNSRKGKGHDVQLSKALSYILRLRTANYNHVPLADGDTDHGEVKLSCGKGHDVQLSKALSYILRHGAAKEGLQMSEGFVFVDDILKLRQFQRYSEDDVRRVVADNDKKRFALRDDPTTNRLQIRANQGHTIEVDDLELDPITDHSEAPVVVHGTYQDCWPLIKTTGLSKMSRNHIHFAPGEPGEEGVISGMRKSCEILIFVNLQKALNDGYKFYRSANNVILCPGNEQGFLPPCYFQRVVQTRPRKELLLSSD